ncbi:hypothetical protein BpHYR1_008786, partial [Brachionus plicatilis]
KLNKAINEATNEITEEQLTKKNKMKFNSWWDMDIKELYNEYKKAKRKYFDESTTINKIMYKNAKKAFRNKQKNKKMRREQKKS